MNSSCNLTNFLTYINPVKIDLSTCNYHFQTVSKHLASFYSIAIVVWIILTIKTKLSPPLQSLRYGIEILIVNSTTLLILPIFVLILIVLLVIRLLIRIYLHFRYKGKIQLIGGRDAFWATDTPFHTNYIYSLSIFEGSCTLQHLRNLMNRKFELDSLLGSNIYERIRCKIVRKCGFQCYAQDGKFHIDNHVKYFLPSDSSRPLSRDEIFSEITSRYDTPMPEDHPKWEILLIPNFLENDTTKPHFAFVSKYNHGYWDGICMVSTFNWFLADFPVKLTLDPFLKPKIPLVTSLLANLKLLILGPRALINGLWPERHSYHGPLLKGPKTLATSRPINLQALKAIKNKLHTSITSILVIALTGSLRRAGLKFQELGEMPEIPRVVNALVTSAMFPYQGLKPCNRFTMAGMPLQLHQEDIGRRIECESKSLGELSKSVDFFANFYMIGIIGLLPAGIIRMIVQGSKSSTLIFSNVPGPKEMFTVNGGQMKELVSFNVIVGHSGLGISACSAGGSIQPGFIGDGTIFPPAFIKELAKQYENEIEELAKYAEIDMEKIQIFN